MSSRSIILLVAVAALAAGFGGPQLLASGELVAGESLSWKADAGSVRLTAKPDQAYLVYTAKKRPATQLAQDEKLTVRHSYRHGTEAFRTGEDEVVVVLALALLCDGPKCQPCDKAGACPVPPAPDSLRWVKGEVADVQSLTWKVDAGSVRLTAKPDQACLAYTAKKRPATQLPLDEKRTVQLFYLGGKEAIPLGSDEVVVVGTPVLSCGPVCQPCDRAACEVPPPPPPPKSLTWVMGSWPPEPPPPDPR